MNISSILELLESHPAVSLHKAVLLPGIGEEELARVESDLGVNLTPVVRDFFLAHNGVAIEWSLREESDEAGEVLRSEDDYPNMMEEIEDYGPRRDGRLVISPLDEVLVPEYDPADVFNPFGAADGYFEFLESVPQDAPDGFFHFGERTFASVAGFRSKLRYFDLFQRDTGVVLLYEFANPDPTVIYEPYRGGGYDPSQTVSLSKYLELVIQHLGSAWRRDLFFRQEVEVQEDLDWKERLEEILDFCRMIT